MSMTLACLALAVYFEARGEPLAGQLAVANTIMNRVADHRHPDDVCSVVKQGPVYASGQPKRHRCQFSFWCDGKPEKITDQQAWTTAKQVARHAIDAPLDVSEGATFYHADHVDPTWRHTMNVTTKIGRHVFYSP